MKKIYLLLIIQFAIVVKIFPQAPNILWQKTYGGSTGEIASSFQQTSDGGYILAGTAYSGDGNVFGNHGGSDYWVVKLKSDGNIKWKKCLGGLNYDHANSIQQTSDGGYIVAGYSFSNDGDVSVNHGGMDYWIVKLSSSGIIEWEKSLGGSSDDIATSIQQTSDGGYIVGGYSTSNDIDVSGNHGLFDYWIVKLNSSGGITWQKSLGGSGTDYATSIQKTSDGGYIVAGSSSSNDGNVSSNHGNNDYWIVKLNNIGTITWQKSLGGTNSDNANSIQQTSDGGYIVAGSSASNDGDVSGNNGSSDYWIVKLNNVGVITWQQSFGGSGSDDASFIQETSDAGFIVAGNSTSNNGDVNVNYGYIDCWIIKLNSTGTILWQKTLGGTQTDYANCIRESSNGAFILFGTPYSHDGNVSFNRSLHSGNYWMVKLVHQSCSNNVSANGPTTFCEGGNVTLTANPGTYYLWNTGSTNQSIFIDTTGTYTAYTDGCQFGYSFTVINNPNPESYILSGPTIFCEGSSVTLTANFGAGGWRWYRNGTPFWTENNQTYVATLFGYYQVENINGYTTCSTMSSILPVYENSLPNATITANGPIAFCAGGSVTFTTSSGTGYTYQWKKDNVNIPGATNINYTATTAGNYKVKVTDSNGCSKTSPKKTVTVPCRENGAIMANEIQKINVFPSPAFDVLNIELPDWNSMAEIKIYNSTGQSVKTEKVFLTDESIQMSFDIKELASGIYSVSIIGQNKMSSVRFIKD